MASRTTKAWIEVLSVADPKPRASKAWIEVLSGAAPQPRVTKAWIEVLSVEQTATARRARLINFTA